jgi:hypothetical protein
VPFYDTLLGRPAPLEIAAVDALERGPARAPDARAMAGELQAPLQLARLLRAAPWLLRAPRGAGTPVIDLPGWRAPEISMTPLRAYLRLLGHRPRAWGLGVNRGSPIRDTREMIKAIAGREAGPTALVGWSLGGVVAREVARQRPDLVSRVVTMGTPILGGPTYTAAARFYGEDASRAASAAASRANRSARIEVPLTVIFSRADGVVDWRACIDRTTQGARHVEVRSTHIGLGIDPDVWWTVAGALAEPALAA